MNFSCPVCFYDRLSYPPRDYHICPCCGTEFDNDDAEYSYAELRDKWIADGADWFFGKPPDNWSPWAQLAKTSFGVIAEGVTTPNIMKIRSGGQFEYSMA